MLKKTSDISARMFAVIYLLPYAAAFVTYVAWVIASGGDPTLRPGAAHIDITGSLLSVRNIVGIIINGCFVSVIGGTLGTIFLSMFFHAASFMEDAPNAE
ncbi:hypothetical protein G6L37_00935 [Agrobacterium rubi]|nr:hypothetical protein [Agrobacterium rubi]NTF23956.1 hypothetical protein [Agrobacterium rubi]